MKVLSRVFRGKFCAGLKRLYRRKKLRCAGPAATLADAKQFRQLLRRLHRQDWVVYAKPAFGGPVQVLRYLGRYTHRVAISNHRLLAFDGERVTFRWKDYAHGEQTAQDDARGDGVPAPILPARTTQGLRPDSPLRLFGKLAACLPAALMPALFGHEHTRTTRIGEHQRKLINLALSTLRRGYGRDTKTDRRGTLAMRVLRFVVAPWPTMFNGRALSTLADRVPVAAMSRTHRPDKAAPPHHPCCPASTPLPAGLIAVASFRPGLAGTKAASNSHSCRVRRKRQRLLQVSLSKTPRHEGLATPPQLTTAEAFPMKASDYTAKWIASPPGSRGQRHAPGSPTLPEPSVKPVGASV